MNSSSAKLLLEIAHCPIVDACLQDPSQPHPCRTIVESQYTSRNEFHVPEPWSGGLSTAPILFVSSNPSIWNEAEYPTALWADKEILDYFENRFGGGKKEWIRQGSQPLKKSGEHAKGTKFWQSVRQRARELLEREPMPGEDYALTEVVHCKSEGEFGVSEALEECMERYLPRILQSAAARVIIVLGQKAALGIKRHMSIPIDSVIARSGDERGQQIFVFLPHPNARGHQKSLAANVGDARLADLRQHLRSSI